VNALVTGALVMLQRLRLYGPVADMYRTLDGHLPRAARRRLATERLYAQFVRPGDTAFDVGANRGDRTAVLAELGARVLAVEPQPSCAHRLRRRFAEMPRVAVVEVGLGAEKGTARLAVAQASGIASMSPGWMKATRESGTFAAYRWDRSIDVPVVTLDDLIAEHGVPSFAKIDVEGYEPQVLAGLSQSIPALCFEFTPEWLDAAFACLDRLALLGEYEFNYDQNESMVLGLPTWSSGPDFRSVLTTIGQAGQPFGNVYARLRGSRPAQ
jgi:FkbM family methyltransferase